MFEQELREGARRNEGETFKHFLGRRILVGAFTLLAISALAFAFLVILRD